MKYDLNLTRKICSELSNIPNIRHVCKKFGINHSTFYRWMYIYNDFYKQAKSALIMGREKICDAAEANIISGIQSGDINCSKYFLSHNDRRYANMDRIGYMEHVYECDHKTLTKTPKDEDNIFHILYEQYNLYEISKKTRKHAKRLIDPFVKNICHGDPDLEELFYAGYPEWRKNRHEKWEKMNDVENHYTRMQNNLKKMIDDYDKYSK